MAKANKVNRLAAIATRHQVLLERLKSDRAKNLAAIFTEVDRQTRAVLSELEVASLDELSRRKLTAILESLDNINGKTLQRGVSALMNDLEELSEYEAAFELRSLRSLGFKSAGGIVAPTAHAAYSLAQAQPMSATGSLLKNFVESWKDGELVRMNNVVRRAWGEGWTIPQLTQAIRGTKANAFKDGILATSRRNAETVARTSIQHVASTARQATWEANSDVIEGYIYIATLDGRTTQACRSLDRKEFEFGKGPIPPIHPNCRSTTIAKLDPALDFLDEGATRSSADGYVDADTTYYDWLKNQSAEFQDAAIGATRGKLFRDGGLSAEKFAQLNLGRHFEPLTLDEMRRLEPLAFKRAGIDE